MQLIPAKCPDCGADIKIPEGSTQIVCEFCGGNILVTDLLGSIAVMQNCMTLAFTAMESGNYKDAYDHFNRAIEIDLKNPNAWFGKAVCTGMTRKLNENSFGLMIDLFENAFKYAPADKQANMKKNAAAEIVKVLRKSEKIIQLGTELLALQDDKEFAASTANEISNIKEKVKITVLKAQEYDPSNKDVTVLLDEVTGGKFFEPEWDAADHKTDDSISKEFKSLADKLNTPPQVDAGPSPVSQNENTKKGGCSLMLIILMMVFTAAGFLLIFR